jgi:hypothetical protein
MDMPPTRYRVEERGRRLVVIDRATGNAVSGRSPPSAPPPVWRWRWGLKRPQATPDHFVTRLWFDDKAPRAIRLNFRTRAQLDQLRMGGAVVIALAVVLGVLFWPWFPVLLVGLLAPQRARSQLRKGLTRWLDRLDRAD